MTKENDNTKGNPTMKELFNKAHDLGLEIRKVELLTTPDENCRSAIVRTTIMMAGKESVGLGYASEENVNQKVSTNLVGVAETRALAKAIRMGANFPKASIVELSPDEFGDVPATEPQKKYIKDLFGERKVPDSLETEIRAAGEKITFAQAHDFIQRLMECVRKKVGALE